MSNNGLEYGYGIDGTTVDAGSQENPYAINDLADLQAINSANWGENTYYQQTANIVLTSNVTNMDEMSGGHYYGDGYEIDGANTYVIRLSQLSSASTENLSFKSMCFVRLNGTPTLGWGTAIICGKFTAENIMFKSCVLSSGAEFSLCNFGKCNNVISIGCNISACSSWVDDRYSALFNSKNGSTSQTVYSPVNCVAISSSVSGGSGTRVHHYRMSVNGGTNNYASSDCVPISASTDATSNDGATITQELYLNPDFWFNNVGGSLSQVYLNYDADVWEWDAVNSLPKLKHAVIQIRTAQDLVDFATRVNAGATDLDAQLLADIDLTGVTWTTIGNSTTAYTGTVDGNGHKISHCDGNFVYGANASLSKIAFENCVYGTPDVNEYFIYKCDIDQCYFRSLVRTNYSGICKECNISDSAFINCSITNISEQWDFGLMVMCKTVRNTYVSGCTINSSISAGSVGASPSFVCNDGSCTTYDSVVVSATCSASARYAFAGNFAIRYQYPQIVAPAVLSNCYINSAIPISSGDTYTKVANATPVALSVMRNESFWHGGSYLSWDFVNTWYWDATDKLPKLRAFVVQISTISELMGFARRVNNGETSLDGLMTADIDATGVTWVTIGDSSQPFDGTLDGDGHTISNLNEIFMICRNSRVSRIKFYNCILDFTSRSNYSALLFSAIPTTECTFEEIWVDTCTFKYFCPSGCYGASASIFGANGTTVNISDTMATNCTLDSTGYDNGCGGGGVVALVCGGATTLNMENCYLNGMYFGTPHGKRDTNVSAVFYGGSFAMEVAAHTHTIDECLFIGTSTQGYVYATHSSVTKTLTKMYYDATSVRSHIMSYHTDYAVDGTEVAHDLVNQQGFYDGTGIAGTTYLDWDFVDTWEWDAENNSPILKIFAQNPAPTVKIWNGTNWVDGTPHVWNGTAWKQAEKVWVHNGTEWKEKL